MWYSPVALMSFVISLLVGTGLVVTAGPRPGAVGPAVLLITGAGWNLWMEELRHRSWLRHRDNGFAPGTQHLVLLGTFGGLLCSLAAVIWAAWAFPRKLP